MRRAKKKLPESSGFARALMNFYIRKKLRSEVFLDGVGKFVFPEG